MACIVIQLVFLMMVRTLDETSDPLICVDLLISLFAYLFELPEDLLLNV